MRCLGPAALAFSLFSATADAAPPAPVGIPDLIARSDLVVAGRFTEFVTAPGRTTAARIHVDRLIKGKLPDTGKDLNLGIRNHSRAADMRYEIFFLQGREGNFTFTDPNLFSLVAAPPIFQRFAVQRDPISQIAAELATVFMVPANLTSDQGFGLEVGPTLIFVPSGRDENGKRIFEAKPKLRTPDGGVAYFNAETALRSIPVSVRLPFLLSVMDAGGPPFGRLWAYAALLQAGDKSHLETEEGYLLHPSEEAPGTNFNLMYSFQYVMATDQDASFFARIMASPNEYIREGAVSKLRNLQSPTALRALGAALQDEDPDVRRSAITAVCSHLNICGGMAPQVLDRQDTVAYLATAYRQWRAAQPDKATAHQVPNSR